MVGGGGGNNNNNFRAESSDIPYDGPPLRVVGSLLNEKPFVCVGYSKRNSLVQVEYRRRKYFCFFS